MISSIALEDFKGHRGTVVDLGRFTVLVGPNGSGKTSVLEALRVQNHLVRRSAHEVLAGDWSPADLLRRGMQGPSRLTARGTSGGEEWSLKFELHAGPTVYVEWHRGPLDGRADQFGAPLGNNYPWMKELLGAIRFYKLNARSIAAAAYSDEPSPDIEFDGTNTAVTLAAIKLGQDEDFARIEEEMRLIVPNVVRVRIQQAPVHRESGQVLGNKIFFDFRGASAVPAHAASEGTLIVLALLAALHGPHRPRMLLLDDFDQSLHPQAQMELVRLLKRLLDEFQDLQIVATTHSPYILDELEPSDVQVFALRDDGTVATKRLTEHPAAARMKGVLSAGQLWSLDREQVWVLAEKSA